MYQINALNPKDEGHHTRKRFGQNFLHDQRVIAKIVRSVNPRAGENIVEIGPGLAALTSPLIGECDALTVIELDRDSAAGRQALCPCRLRLQSSYRGTCWSETSHTPLTRRSVDCIQASGLS